uniref:Uncharacterized protein n=1 Tax=Caldiarchaeum subterraneum TaxID=311458 RepID=E6N3L8_CALS0|nr:hypothetical protein HGMM_F37B02C07 [Candidatus Caldarchaeum subterraneum]
MGPKKDTQLLRIIQKHQQEEKEEIQRPSKKSITETNYRSLQHKTKRTDSKDAEDITPANLADNPTGNPREAGRHTGPTTGIKPKSRYDSLFDVPATLLDMT